MVEARVEYDYDAENEDELSLQVGDIITNIERKEDGWWEGHLRGKVGLFPSNFVKILNKDQAKQSLRSTKAYSNGVQLRSGNPLTKRKRRCRVVYSYTPVNDDELELEVNNVIEVLEEVEEGWWKGILHGQVGVFPSNFVVEIDDVDEATSDSKQVSTSGLTDNGELEIKPKPVRGVDLGIILDEKSIQLKPVQESLDRKNTIAPKKPPAPTPPVSNDAAPVLPPKPVKEQAKAIFPYEACNEDELTLREGDIITILAKEVEDKGWWKGELNNKIGLFPDNFVVLLSTPEVKPKKPERPDKIPHLIKKILPSKPESSGSKGPNIPVQEPMKRSLPDVIKKDDKTDKIGPPLPIKKPHLPPPMKKPQRPPNLPSVSVSESLTDDMKAKSQEEKHVDNVTDKSAFDSIEPSADKLTHLTATRAKNPHRRPPSYLFLRENHNSSKETINENSEISEEENKDPTKVNELIIDTPPPITQEVILENEKKPVKPTSTVMSPPVTPAPPKRSSEDVKTASRPPVLKTSESDSKLLTNVVRPKPQVLAPKPLICQKDEAVKKLSAEGSSITGLNEQLPEDSRSRDSLARTVEDLSNQVLLLHQALDTQKKLFSEKIRELILEIDEEKKIRMTMQVEIDRLYKLVKE